MGRMQSVNNCSQKLVENSHGPAKDRGEIKRSAFGFIWKSMVIALGLLSVNIFISAQMIGHPTFSSQVLCDQVSTRVDLVNERAGERVILIGGSGVRAGLSAHQISHAFGVNAFNFGLQASFGPEVILHEAKKLLRKGDTAILLFEYPLYFQDKWNPIALDYALGCAPELITRQTPERLVEALMAQEFSRFWEVARYSVTNSTSVALPTNEYGDRLPESFPPVSEKKKQRMKFYQPATIGINQSARGPEAIRSFVAWAKNKGIQVLASWPNTIDFPEYRNKPGFEDIRQFYGEQEVAVIGEPSIGLLPLKEFYDTQYHLHYDAIQRRTERFIHAVRHQEILFKQFSYQGG